MLLLRLYSAPFSNIFFLAARPSVSVGTAVSHTALCQQA